MAQKLVNEEKRSMYEKVVRIHLERGPVDHDYSFGFMAELLEDVLSLYDNCPKVEYINAPVNICGDVRSRYGDILDVFRTCGWPFEQKYVFLGNLFDGGKFSLETLVLLFCCKLCWPENFVIMRGYFENEIVKTERSFIGELRVKYPDGTQWQTLNVHFKTLLSRLPCVTILNRKIVCLNGMVTSNIKNEKNVVSIKNGNTWESHFTRLEVVYGEIDVAVQITPNKIEEETKVLRDLLKSIDMSMVINSNNVIKQGYQFSLANQLLTLTTGTNMAKTIKNRGVVMMMDRQNKVHFKNIYGLEGQENPEQKRVTLRC
uniref:SER_THR_PHOSPHATASE domain-containing protein n=1 Tax=Caenorhabditis japonica TaxID=281687 RepID=A0A8R1HP06_CAEJA